MRDPNNNIWCSACEISRDRLKSTAVNRVLLRDVLISMFFFLPIRRGPRYRVASVAKKKIKKVILKKGIHNNCNIIDSLS